MGEPVIQTINLTKIFKDFWGRSKVIAVDSLDLTIQQGEVYGLLGPNGSGKTTTIKMLLGLLYPTRGKAYVFGRSPENVEVKTRIGYLPEETRLYQFLDSWETLDFYGSLFDLDRSERERRAEALIEMVGLKPAASRPVGQYSKGMARRIGLAQALINDPDLIIFDEPTSGMDPIGTRQIKDLILELKKRGKTILLSSHLLADVEDVCDKIGIMYGGKLLCSGPIEKLLQQQELLQVITEKLQESQITELKEIIEKKFRKKIISIGPPQRRLEEFFLLQVKQAEERLTTFGATAGGKVSEFLLKEKKEEKDILKELVKEPEPQEETEKPTSTEKEVSEKRLEELQQLVKDEDLPTIKEKERTIHTEKEEKEEKIDTQILEELVEKEEERRTES